VFENQIAKTEALQKELDRIVPHLFHRNGEPIKTFRRSWVTACKKAGVPGKIRHDFRRTAYRNLERAGVPRSAAMKAIGHRSESVYRRYSIVDESMLKEAAAKLEQLHAADRQKSRNGKAMAE
jgi:integrase